MILSKGVPSWGFIGIRFYLPPTHPEQERCPWGLSYASAPSQTRFTCSTRSRRHPPGQFGICTGTRFHHPLAASASYNIQKALGNALQTQKAKKPRAGARLVCRVTAGMVHGPRIRFLSQLAVPAAAQQPFVSQPVCGGALPFIAINVQKINGK